MDSKLAEPWQQFIEELGFSPALDGPYESLMQGWKTIVGKLMSRYDFPLPDLSVQAEDKILGGVPTRIYTPADVADPPLALYFHAGGWVMGSINEEDGFVRTLCKLVRMRILSVGYRLAPEFRFPMPLDDCLTVARSALETYPAQSICFIGASAGGNMAFSTALALVSDDLGDRVQGVVALAPVTVHPDSVSADKRDRGEYTSYEENDRLTINTGSAMRSFFDCYGAPPDDPRLSCLLHPDLGKLNKVYMAVGGADTLRDDVRLMRDALVALDVPVKCDEYPGYPHFSWLFPSPALREHQALFFGNLLSGIGWVCE